MRRFSWPFGPPLILLLSTLSLLASTTSALDSTTNTLSHPLHVTSLLPSYYDPTTDQVCFRNGIRYTFCNPAIKIVPLNVAQRSSLTELVQGPASAPGGMQLVLYAMLTQVDTSLHHPGGPDNKGDEGENFKDKVEDHIHATVGKGKGMHVKICDVDPKVMGKKIAERLHVPEVTEEEDSCYHEWLAKNGMGEKEVNTVLNEIFVRHVARVMSAGKRLLIEGGTGCASNSAPEMKHDIAKEWNELRKDEGAGIHILDKGIQKRNKAEKDEACFEDDMKVYHPVHGTHLDDPWLHHRQKHHVRNDEYGSRKRSIGGEYLVTHKHHRRGGQQQPQNPSSFLPSGIDESAYFNGLPTTPITDPTSSSSSSSGSALTSKPHGFASSVTGGGSSPPIVPKSINELEKLLTDPQPRVIHLDRTYDFRGSAGTCTNCAGCIPDSYAKCPSKGQLAINNGQGWCNGKPAHAVTYDKAGLTPIRMGPNKSVIGITPNAGIRGKGLLIAHQKNVILQGFTLDYINAEFIWGGDGLTIRDSDLVWIDRITFRLIGRQFIVTGYESAGRVTISNCFFDCETKWSATCDNSHYWTVLGYGKSDKVTFSGNLMKHCSGRSPRIANPDDKGGDSVWHVVNSAFEGSTGHSFDMGPGITALIEGNVFNDVAQTSLHESSPGRAFAPSDKAVCTQCKGVLGRDCQPNAYSRANPIPSTTSPGVVLKDVVGEEMVGALPPGQVREQIGSTAGCNGAKGDAVGGAGAGAVGDGSEPEGYGDTAATADAGASANPGNGRGQPNPDGGAGTDAPMPYVPGQQNPANAEPQQQPQLQPGQQQQKQTSSGNPFLDGGSGGSNPFDPNSRPEGYGQPPNAEQQKQAEQQKKQQEQQQKQAQDPMKQQQQQQQKQQAEEQKKQQQKREQQEKKQQEEQQKQWQQWQQQQQQPHH